MLERVATWEDLEATQDGDRGGRSEAADLDELAKLEAVGEDEINVLCRKGDIGRVGGVRES